MSRTRRGTATHKQLTQQAIAIVAPTCRTGSSTLSAPVKAQAPTTPQTRQAVRRA